MTELPPEQALERIRQLVTDARAISPSRFMSIYVADIEQALGWPTPQRPHKKGMSDDE